jgi:hypothetical protein
MTKLKGFKSKMKVRHREKDGPKLAQKKPRPTSLVGSDERFFCAGSASVTTAPEIIPYYRLNHSFWSLSDNKEVSVECCRVYT